MTPDRPARVEDVRELALGLPHVTVVHGPRGNPVYQVGGRSFIFFRTPRADAVDAVTGERLTDVIVFWVESEADKQALVQDPDTPFFTTSHFDRHNSVLVQASRLGDLTRSELAELVQEAWLARASSRRRTQYLTGDPSRSRVVGGNRALPADASVFDVVDELGEAVDGHRLAVLHGHMAPVGAEQVPPAR